MRFSYQLRAANFLAIVFAVAVGFLSSRTVLAQTNLPAPGQLVPKPAPPPDRGVDLRLTVPEPLPAESANLTMIAIGSIVLDDENADLRAVTDPLLFSFMGRSVPVRDIYNAVAAIEQIYVDHGYFLTRVIVPAQHVTEGGTLHLTVLHGFLESIDLAEVPEAFRDRVQATTAPLIGRKDLTRAQFERALLIAGDLPSIRLRAQLRPGAEQGAAVLVLAGEYHAVTSTLQADDYLPLALGKSSLTVSSAYTPPHGDAAQLYATASTAGDTLPFSAASPRRLLIGGVRSPIGISGAVLNFEATWSQTAPRPAAGVIATRSSFERAAIRGTYPLVKTRQTTVTVDGDFDITVESQMATRFDIVQYRDRLIVARTGLTVDHALGSDTSIVFNTELSHGLPGLGSRDPSQATSREPLSQLGGSNVFTKVEWQASVRHQLTTRDALQCDVHGQHTSGAPLLLAEKFTLGGPGDLSGYDTASFSGDRGYALRAEAQHRYDWPRLASETAIQFYGFAAHGQTSLIDPTAVEQRTSPGSSAGAGARSSTSRHTGTAGPFEFSAEIARQFNSSASHLNDHWRVNLAASIRF